MYMEIVNYTGNIILLLKNLDENEVSDGKENVKRTDEMSETEKK